MKFVSFGSRTNKSDAGYHKFDSLFHSLERTKQKKRIHSTFYPPIQFEIADSKFFVSVFGEEDLDKILTRRQDNHFFVRIPPHHLFISLLLFERIVELCQTVGFRSPG